MEFNRQIHQTQQIHECFLLTAVGYSLLSDLPAHLKYSPKNNESLGLMC